MSAVTETPWAAFIATVEAVQAAGASLVIKYSRKVGELETDNARLRVLLQRIVDAGALQGRNQRAGDDTPHAITLGEYRQKYGSDDPVYVEDVVAALEASRGLGSPHE